ncbi:type VI secretion protein VasK [Burkholderia sp. SRS-W-2-2016]|uniref:ImcF-related family protein n=1 Tax=Burkholderia sp. SRS-W-2-2016 TaxID=1926878 RepID=UPI00094AF3CB|nr:ImcF-related family protein [Burkholderia sp. SRS-W-2-2016]OLL28233.1 type VI secretion protein VasK [Burkholderia sp. SRS-W-2-2016]
MNRKFRLDLLGIILLVVLPGLITWTKPAWVGIAPENRSTAIVLLCGLFVILFLVFSFSDSSRPAIARRSVRLWLIKHAHQTFPINSYDTDTCANRILSLKRLLVDRHGWRWRYREQWVLVAGDEPLVKRLAPGLTDTGYTIAGDTVLLYAKQTTDKLETEWLSGIRRLRRRRPIDAIVAVTDNRISGKAPFDTDALARRLARHAKALRWAAPAYLMNVTDFGTASQGPDEVIGLTWADTRVNADGIRTSLQGLMRHLADTGVARLGEDNADRYRAQLSQHIERLGNGLSALVLQTANSRYWRQAIHGLLFAPLFKKREFSPLTALEKSNNKADDQAETEAESIVPAQRSVWQTIADHSRTVHGRRVGFSLSTTAAWITTGLVACWIAGTTISGLTNRTTIATSRDTLTKLAGPQDTTHSLQTLNILSDQIDTLETRQRNGAPWPTRFGLNRDNALLTAIWPAYENAASRILVTPIREKLEDRLHQLASMSDEEIASGGDTQTQAAYNTLKAYLMLAKPERAAAAFLTPQLIATTAPSRPANSPLTSGTWEDLREHTIAFFANHLGHRVTANGSSLAIVPDGNLVASTRQTIISVRGIQNSTDAVYQQILDDAKPKYPPLTLATLLGDTTGRGLFNTTQTIPGVFTRAAWEERISKAIDDASEQGNVAGDWVLSDTKTKNQPPSTLKDELRQRYFDDYTRAWEQFLNSLRWQSAPTLSATSDQLTLLGDPQRSPLVALMNAIVYQAGTGASTQSLSDTLISKAQQLVGADEKDPSKQAQPQLAPLAIAFGPILRLTGSDLLSAAPGKTGNAGNATAQLAATGDLSLARYLERVTAMRLKIEQMVNSADTDAMSRVAAQSVLQGKTSDIAESRDYASRVAASLGQQWAGFGQLLQAPLDQTWQAVVQPAAASLNEIWRTSILADWNRSFGGRYPFADSENDASLPEMARFMRPDNGVIAQFVTTQLAGVIERQGDRWVAAQGTDRGSQQDALRLAPGFLDSLNRLTRVSTVMFPGGDAHIRFDLRGVATPGVTDMKIVLSGRQLNYFNQKEDWVPFEWPGQSLENLSRIEWQTEQGGLRSALDAQGRFGLIRLLERATVSQQDNARYLLSWAPDTSQGIALKVQLRSDAGAGPLDVLQLRRFALPTRIFVTGGAKPGPKPSASNPPPLPPAALAAAKHAAIPLPRGFVPEVE